MLTAFVNEGVRIMSHNQHTLNPQQNQAATTLEGPMLVIAGAGSGKTRVVTVRMVNLLNAGVPPWAILGVTFTNKAAQEMKERVNRLTHHHVNVSTFHSLGARILRESIHHLNYPKDFTIYDENDSEKVLKLCLKELAIEEKKSLKGLRSFISEAKNSLKSPEDFVDEVFENEYEQAFPQVYHLYNKILLEYGAVDFDDLLYLPVRLWREHPEILGIYQNRWKYILIDEYQDTNHAQYIMTKLLADRFNNLFVVGDPDQSIYSWRGANIQNILNFESDYPKAIIIRLEQNYRSHTNILQAANALISFNESRLEKDLWSDLDPGEKIQLFSAENDREEAGFIASQINYFHLEKHTPLNEMVVFYRTNAQSRTFEDDLLYRGIPYTIVGGISFYQRREIKDILAFLRIAQTQSDFVAFDRTINIPKRGVGGATIEKIRKEASIQSLPVMVYLRRLLTDASLKNAIRLTSKQKEGLTAYLNIIDQIQDLIKQGSLKEIVQGAIQATHYLSFLKEEPDTLSERKENLDSLITKAIEWELNTENPSLEAFLEELSLKSSLDEASSPDQRLSLMTIHNGKGLEFKVVFLAGLEEDLFPHANSRESKDKLEEERRLCYVGMTRAKEHLYLTHCRTRYLWGELRFHRPSRFIREIPGHYLDKCKRRYDL